MGRFQFQFMASSFLIFGTVHLAIADRCVDLDKANRDDQNWQWGSGKVNVRCDQCLDALYVYFYGVTPSEDIFKRVGAMVSGIISENPSAFSEFIGPKWKGNPGKAVDMIIDGQKQNSQIMARYRETLSGCSSNESFIESFVGAGPWPVEPGAATNHLIWQVEKNPISVVSAYKTFAEQSNNVRGRIWAMFMLLRGQAHNDAARLLYRAAYRGSPEKFFAEVKRVIDAHDGYKRAESAREQMLNETFERTKREGKY